MQVDGELFISVLGRGEYSQLPIFRGVGDPRCQVRGVALGRGVETALFWLFLFLSLLLFQQGCVGP